MFELDLEEVRRRAGELSQLRLLRAIILKSGVLRPEAMAVYREVFAERFGSLEDLCDRADDLLGEVEFEIPGVERMASLRSDRDPSQGVLVASDRGLGFRPCASSMSLPLPLLAELDPGTGAWAPLDRIDHVELWSPRSAHVVMRLVRRKGSRVAFRVPDSGQGQLEPWLESREIPVFRRKTLFDQLGSRWRRG